MSDAWLTIAPLAKPAIRQNQVDNNEWKQWQIVNHNLLTAKSQNGCAQCRITVIQLLPDSILKPTFRQIQKL
jgi:hypothetical protein